MNIAIKENQVGVMNGIASNIYDTLVFNDQENFKGVPIFGITNKPAGTFYDFDGNIVDVASGTSFITDAVTGFVIDVNGDLVLYHYSDANLENSSYWKLWGDLKYSFTVNRGLITIKSIIGTQLQHMNQGDKMKCILCGLMTAESPFENARDIAYLVAVYTKGADNTATATYTWRSVSWILDDIAQNHGYTDVYHGVFNAVISSNPGSVADLQASVDQLQTEIDDLNKRVLSVEVSNNSRYVSR